MLKSGIKTWTMLSSFVLALVFMTGCNSEETTDTTTPKPGATAPTVKPTETKPTTGTAPTKPDEKK